MPLHIHTHVPHHTHPHTRVKELREAVNSLVAVAGVLKDRRSQQGRALSGGALLNVCGHLKVVWSWKGWRLRSTLETETRMKSMTSSLSRCPPLPDATHHTSPPTPHHHHPHLTITTHTSPLTQFIIFHM